MTDGFVKNVVAVTLGLILVAVVLAMLVGLFDSRVDNKEVLAILGPAFQMIVGAFVGILADRAFKK